MKRALILIVAASSYVLAQDTAKVVTYQSIGAGGAAAWGTFEKSVGSLVQGAPYSATISNELVQTLADGNRIVQSSSGTTARDSQGRTRQKDGNASGRSGGAGRSAWGHGQSFHPTAR